MTRWLIDFDSTLSDTFTGAVKKVNERFGTSFTLQDFASWNTEDILTEEAARYMWGEEVFFNPEFQATCEPIKGAVEGVHEILSKGHKVFVVSDRKHILYEGTREWLDMQGLAEVELIFTRSPKHSTIISNGMHTKSQVAYYKRLKNVVEDAPHHSLALANRSYIDKVYMLDMPYNKDVKHPKIERIYSWEAVG